MNTSWQDSPTFFIFHILIWLSVWTGAWLSAFGTVASFPDALRRKQKGYGQVHDYIIKPLVYNAACWGTPLLVLISELTVAVIAQRQYNQLHSAHAGWSVSVDEFRSLPQEEQDRLTMIALREAAAGVWDGITKVYWYYSIAHTMWTVWAVLALVVYTSTGWLTVTRVREAVKLAELQLQRRNAPEAGYLPPLDYSGQSSPLPADVYELKSPVTAVMAKPSNVEIIFGEEEDLPSSLRTPHRTLQTPQATLFPALKASPASSKWANLSPAERRCQAIRSIHRNILIQFFTISIAIVCYCVITAYAARNYISARAGGAAIQHLQVTGNLMAAWTNCVFGSIVMVLLLWRSFDPSLSLREEPADGTSFATSYRRRRSSSAFTKKGTFDAVKSFSVKSLKLSNRSINDDSINKSQRDLLKGQLPVTRGARSKSEPLHFRSTSFAASSSLGLTTGSRTHPYSGEAAHHNFLDLNASTANNTRASSVVDLSILDEMEMQPPTPPAMPYIGPSSSFYQAMQAGPSKPTPSRQQSLRSNLPTAARVAPSFSKKNLLDSAQGAERSLQIAEYKRIAFAAMSVEPQRSNLTLEALQPFESDNAGARRGGSSSSIRREPSLYGQWRRQASYDSRT
ncbi:MAG: hypothetical protein EOO40_00040 [Deltaproteobacteria bacterium]|nr:MAG: hypothetical protein EOO40_00040 [Deltaproteobacteria bacterium]